ISCILRITAFRATQTAPPYSIANVQPLLNRHGHAVFVVNTNQAKPSEKIHISQNNKQKKHQKARLCPLPYLHPAPKAWKQYWPKNYVNWALRYSKKAVQAVALALIGMASCALIYIHALLHEY